MFVGKRKSLPRVEHPNVASPGKALALLANIRLGWKGLPWTNTSLLRKLVNYGGKMFYRIGPRGIRTPQHVKFLLAIVYSDAIPSIQTRKAKEIEYNVSTKLTTTHAF